VKTFLALLFVVSLLGQALADDTDPQKRTPKAGDEVAVMETSLGTVVLMFFPDKAPKHVENFKMLAKSGFYDGTKFHRVIPGFMIQGGDPYTKTGDPSTWGTGGPDKTVKAEFNDVKHERGILSMARSRDPDSAGSQFFIMVKYAPSLDGKYSAFGKVVSGMESVDKIVNLPRNESDRPEEPPVIKSVKIVKWPLKKDG
jgi:peptidyl-prolyl cis-trans isomerase B (cyclophilin B)